MTPLKIILADDHSLYRLGMETLLRKFDSSFEVYNACNGFEVLEIIKRVKIDIVFMDILMPVQNGIEATYRVRKVDHKVKIIGLSENNDKYDVIKMFKAGANGYLLKNASLEKIETAFKTIIKGGNYFTEEIRCFFSGRLREKCRQKLDKLLREKLSEREKEILILICQQYSTREIAEKTALSEKTIEIHRGHIMDKTQSKNMIGLVLYAIEKGFFINSTMVQ